MVRSRCSQRDGEENDDYRNGDPNLSNKAVDGEAWLGN